VKPGTSAINISRKMHRSVTTPRQNAKRSPRARCLWEEAFTQLGENTCDVYLNSRAYWKNVPAKVWDYYIGAYQVIKKWLSYREGKLRGRALTVEEARYVRDMTRRIAALRLMQPQLDANYAEVKANTHTWPS